MITKKATTKTDSNSIIPLNKPVFDDNIIVDHDLKIDTSEVKALIKKIASDHMATYTKDGVPNESISFDLEAEIANHPDSLFVKCFAIKADEMNDNGDYFTRDELCKATNTFVGVPVFTNHQNSDINQARGKVVYSWWDDNRNGIMIIARVDAEAYPQLARGIKEEYVAATSMGCFLGDNRVLTHNGTYIPIRDIQPGDKVITHTGQARDVLNTQIRSKNELLLDIEYEGIGSSIQITSKHPLLTLKSFNKCACGCGKNLPQLKSGSSRANNWKTKYRKRFINGHSQFVWNTNKYSETSNIKNKNTMQSSRVFDESDFEWKPAGQLKPGDVLVFPTKFRKTRKKQPSLAQAKLIGYFLSEGSYKKYNGKRSEVNFSFCFSREKDTYVPEVISLLKENFGKDLSIWTQNRYPDNDVIIVCCHNKKVADWFYKYCGEYSGQKQLPEDFIYWSPTIQKTIIGYFINGDGCNSTRIMKSQKTMKAMPYTDITINSVSHKLVEQFCTSLSRCGIWHTVHANFNRKSVSLKNCVNLGTWTETRNIKGEEFTLNLKPSYSIAINQNYCNKIYPYTRKNSKPLYKMTQTFQDENDILITGPYLCRKIKSINPFVYTGAVYNLQVEGDNSYIVEGITAKNCQVQYSICSVCHNVAESPSHYCTHIREQKTREINAKKQKCEYHKHGKEKLCPICGSTKENIKTFDYSGKSFEHNYGIKFIENSFVVNPACHDCGVTEIIDPQKFLSKVANLTKTLPSMIKAAAKIPIICTDKSCTHVANKEQVDTILSALDFLQNGAEYIKKIAGQEQINDLNQALNLITSVSQDMLKQKDQIDLEFLSDLVKVLADLQEVTDELTEQGYGRLPSPGQQQKDMQTDQSGKQQTSMQPGTPITNPTGGASKIHSGPAGDAGTVTSPMANRKNRLNLEKLSKSLMSKVFSGQSFLLSHQMTKNAAQEQNKLLNLTLKIGKK